MESAAVRLYFLLEHNYSLVTMSCILHIIWVNSCTRNKINFSKDNIARGLCTLVLFIISVIITSNLIQGSVGMNCPAVFQSNCIKWQSSPWFTSSLEKKLANCLKPLTISHLLEKPDPSALYSI